MNKHTCSDLIASSATFQDMQKIVNDFFCTDCNFAITDKGFLPLNSKGVIKGFMVVKKGSRFRLERMEVKQ